MYKKGLGFESGNLKVNIKNLSGYEKVFQVFALFNEGDLREEDMLSAFCYFKGECKKQKNVKICTRINKGKKKGIFAIFAIEGLGNQIDFKLESVERFYDAGVRIMGLCWNNDNCLCGGCMGAKGLTPLGKETLKKMERLKIILDVSHMSDKSFFESLEYYSLPFCATHSLSRTVHNNRRNLTDEEFSALVKRGGVCGVNFCPEFLGGEKPGIDRVIKHIEHFLSLGGEENIGIGSDFDGIKKTPQGLSDSSEVYKLLDAMLSKNYPYGLVEKIAFRNFKNFFLKFTK